MAQIHPTALVDPAAELAGDVAVGPYCIITGDVRLGPGTRLLAHAVVDGPADIGAHNTIHPFCTLGAPPQDRKADLSRKASEFPPLRIGEHNVLREGVSIHQSTGTRSTTLGDHNYLMANSHLGHDAVVGCHCTLANGALLGGHVTLGDQVTIGGNAAVHQFCRVGRLAMLSGGVVVVQDLPPFCITYEMRTVGSLNLVGLRRAGLREHIRPLTRAFSILYREGHTNAVALEMIETELGDDPLCTELLQFVRSTKRGITSHHPL